MTFYFTVAYKITFHHDRPQMGNHSLPLRLQSVIYSDNGYQKRRDYAVVCLLLILLDHLRWTHLRLVRITACFAKGSTLTQEVPALI